MKTMKHIIWMAAIALTAATWTACSNDDEPTTAEQPAQPRIYTVTTTLSPRNGATTRSTMTDNGNGSISAAWEVGDKIWVGYTQNGDTPEETMATVTAVDPTTKAAKITLTLTNPKDGGDITFGYPYSFYTGTKKLLTDQIGTLADINANFAAIYGDVKMTVSGSNITLPAVTMEPAMCIWKFSFTDGANDITSAITKLVIDFPNDGEDPYEITPSSQNTIYVAIYADEDVINAEPICITALTASGFYRKAAASVTLAEGKTYTTTGFALKKAEVGKVFGADGNIYDDVAAANAASTALALITYVGNDAETNTTYNHGLALALTDANSGNKATWCSQSSETCLATQYGYVPMQFNDMTGIAYTDALVAPGSHPHAAANAARNYNNGTHPTGTSAWFLPSAGQWDKMIDAAGGDAALRTNAGLQENRYWSSTEYDTKNSWNYYFAPGWGGWGSDSKDQSSRYVRAALAF